MTLSAGDLDCLLYPWPILKLIFHRYLWSAGEISVKTYNSFKHLDRHQSAFNVSFLIDTQINSNDFLYFPPAVFSSISEGRSVGELQRLLHLES